jgi:hypothetical protein
MLKYLLKKIIPLVIDEIAELLKDRFKEKPQKVKYDAKN